MDFKSVLFLLMVVVPTSYTQNKCCFPSQFEIVTGEEVGISQSGRGSAVFQNAIVAFDYTNRRVGEFANVTQDGKSMFFQVIQDYSKGAQYIIEPQQQTCHKSPLSGPMEHCVPANATYLNTFYLGDKKLTVDNFLISAMGLQASFSITKGDCLPNSQVVMGEAQGASFLSVTGFYNYVSGIKDPSKYFTVPSYCPKSFSNEPRVYGMRRFKMFL